MIFICCVFLFLKKHIFKDTVYRLMDIPKDVIEIVQEGMTGECSVIYC